MLSVRGISKSYSGNGREFIALENVSFDLPEGETCSVIGPSGSGKSTLLNIIGVLDYPDSGVVLYNGRSFHHSSDQSQANFRNHHLGFVFQSFNLLPRLSALDNVGLPLLYRGISKTERRRLALPLLERVGLGDKADHLPRSLSGGQKQRVAFARALIGRPRLILADEPTGNLDAVSADGVLDLIFELNRESGVSVMIVTHDPDISARCHLEIIVDSGQTSSSRNLGL